MDSLVITRILSRRRIHNHEVQTKRQCFSPQQLRSETEINCRKCEKPIKVGDKVVSKQSSSNYGGHKNLYHYSCARRLNIV